MARVAQRWTAVVHAPHLQPEAHRVWIEFHAFVSFPVGVQY